jgi:hypothetical protein
MAAGEEGQSDAILQSLADLYPPTGGTKAADVATTGDKGVSKPPATAKDPDAKTPKEGTIKFVPGVKSSHGFCGLPAFYDKNLKMLRGSIPLTIFDPKWQKKATAHSAERQQIDQGATEERQYTGHPAPDKWSQTYAQWSQNYQCFIVTLQTVYNHNALLTEWTQKHRDRVDELMISDGFCTGFWYDLAVRANSFQCDTVHKGELVFPDISKLHEQMYHSAAVDAKSFDKLNFQDNPYVVGGP